MIAPTTLIIFILFKNVFSYNLTISHIEQSNKQYKGEKFPVQYLIPEESSPDLSDLLKYVENLRRVVEYFKSSPNETDGNVAIGTFYSKAILKRALKDYGSKLIAYENIYINIREIIAMSDYIVSHYVYGNAPYGWKDLEFRVSRNLKEDSVQVYSISEFNKQQLKPWLLSAVHINDFAEVMDDISLSRYKYAEITERMRDYFVTPRDSDFCVGRVMYNPEPIDLSKIHMCRPDPYCFDRLHSSPSTAYALSHRLFNIMMRHQLRRCYFKTEKEDKAHMDTLCAFMYREAVYIARRGFFAKDLFLEHIALCGLLGYEEFHRRRWFNKVITWIDEQGCMKENPNFLYFRSEVGDKMDNVDPKVAKRKRKDFKMYVAQDCHYHPMALMLVVLAHGIRYAAHVI